MTTYTFRNRYSQQFVYLPSLNRTIQFWAEGYDENRRPLGVFRTDDAAVAEALRQAVAMGGDIPVYEEDEEASQAELVLQRKRDKAMAAALATRKAALEAAGEGEGDSA